MRRAALITLLATGVALGQNAGSGEVVIQGIRLYRAERAEICVILSEYKPRTAGAAAWDLEQHLRMCDGITPNEMMDAWRLLRDYREHPAPSKAATQQEIEDRLRGLHRRQEDTAAGK